MAFLDFITNAFTTSDAQNKGGPEAVGAGTGGTLTADDQVAAGQATTGPDALVGGSDLFGFGSMVSGITNMLGQGALGYFGYKAAAAEAGAPKELAELYLKNSKKQERLARDNFRRQLISSAVVSGATAQGQAWAASAAASKTQRQVMLGLGLTAVLGLGIFGVVLMRRRS